MYVEVLYDGCLMIGNSCESVIRQMKLIDWDEPETVLKFKSNVQERLLVLGELILFHDARSFLEAILEADIIQTLIIDEEFTPMETSLKSLNYKML